MPTYLRPITVGLKKISDTLSGFFVRNSSGVERQVYDTDGYVNLTAGVLSYTADATMTDAQCRSNGIIVFGSGATAAKTITAPNLPGKIFFVRNSNATYAITIKVSGQSGVAVDATKGQIVYCNGTDYVQLGLAEF